MLQDQEFIEIETSSTEPVVTEMEVLIPNTVDRVVLIIDREPVPAPEGPVLTEVALC